MRDPVIVMGMMRSGTTLLAEMVHRGGTAMYVEQGNLNPAYDDGIKYERPSTHQINLSILQQTKNIAGIKVIGLPLRPISPDALRELAGEVGEEPWGFKDPRTTITYPVWREAFPGGPRLYIYRGHQEVARYYFRSPKKTLSRCKHARRAIRAWVHFNEQLLSNIRSDQNAKRPHALVRYEELMQRPELIGQLEKAVGISLFDARNFDLHRSKGLAGREMSIFRFLSLGYGKRLANLYRELDALRLK